MSTELKGLEEKLKQARDQAERVVILNDMAKGVRMSNLLLSIEYSRKAEDIARQISHQSGLARSLFNTGTCNFLLGNLEQAKSILNSSIEICDQINDLDIKALALNSMGQVYVEEDKLEKAIEYFEQCIGIAEKLNNQPLISYVYSYIATVYEKIGDTPRSLEYYLKSMQSYIDSSYEVPEVTLNNIAMVYTHLGDEKTALDYYFKALEMSEKHNNRIGMGLTHGNIGVTHNKLGDYTKGLEHLNTGLEILRSLNHVSGIVDILRSKSKTYKKLGVYEKALETLSELYEISDKLSLHNVKASVMLDRGELNALNGDRDEAEKYYFEGLSIAESINDELIIAEANQKIGNMYYEAGKTEDAVTYLNKSLELAGKRNAQKEIMEIHNTLYKLFRKINNIDKALIHHEELRRIEKEQFNTESDKKLRSLSVHYQLVNFERERKIAFQEKEIFRLKNVELANANEELMKLNKEKSVFLGIAAHDLKNPLIGILSFSKKLQKNINSLSHKEVCEFSHNIEQASEKMLMLVSELLDVNKIESGDWKIKIEEFDPSSLLEVVLMEYREKAAAKHIELRYETMFTEKIRSDKISVRQIMDNLISNAVKFSPAGRNVFVRIKRNGKHFRLEVKDEGPGLSMMDKEKLFSKFTRLSAQPTHGEHSTGLGLSIVKRLAEELKGKVWCESEQGKGALFVVELPC